MSPFLLLSAMTQTMLNSTAISDPCWLPSAMMQTTGAMVGIYLAIYLLALPRLLEFTQFFKPNILVSSNIEEKRFVHKGNLAAFFLLIASLAFISLILNGCLTIYYSMLWLESLTTNTPLPTYLGIPVDTLAKQCFEGLLYLIGIYSIVTILVVIYLMYAKKLT